jgi:hypothetical protein
MSDFVESATADTLTGSSEKDKHVIKSAPRFEESQVQVKILISQVTFFVEPSCTTPSSTATTAIV